MSGTMPACGVYVSIKFVTIKAQESAFVFAQDFHSLLAIGRHNRGVLAQTLLSSLAQHYLTKPPCDVLVAR